MRPTPLDPRARQSQRAADVAAELGPGWSPPLLQALHLLTKDGDLNADARRKLKQLQHFVGLLRPAINDALARHAEPVVVDVGSGKGTLGVVLASVLLEPVGRGQVLCVEARPELCQRGQAIADAAGLTRVSFVQGAIESAPLPERVHVVVALHACDTATDDALTRALRHGADHIAVVPCCQAEVARLLQGGSEGALGELHRHAWHRREFGSHVTNVVRALTLESHGYQVTVTELAGWEHSLKNELILGRRVHRENPEARARLAALLEALGVRPKLACTEG